MTSDRDQELLDEALPKLFGQHPHTLQDVARRLTHRTYALWYKSQFQSHFLAMARLAVEREWSDAERTDPAKVLFAGNNREIIDEHVESHLYRRTRAVEGRRALLFGRISMWIRAAIRSQKCITRGMGPTGLRVDIPRDLAPQLVVDLEGNTLRSPDGSLIWRLVTVEVAAAATGSTPRDDKIPLATARRGAAVPIDDEAVVADMLRESERLGDSFSVRSYVLENAQRVGGSGDLHSKIRRMQRKYEDGRKARSY